jgi:RHS repeat-associated protein
VSYTYDANGNQTGASTGRAYTYNVFDQTVSLTPPLGGTVQNATYLGPNQDEIVTRGSDQYANNVLGIGVKVYSDATVSYFTRDENGALLGERAPGGAKYYYIPDGLGSTMATTGSNGAIANSYKYDPYGAVVSATETSAKPTAFRFAGGLYSASLGVHKFGERWYDQSLGRWSQQDPIDQTGDLREGNRYLYGGDNPVNSLDPAGTDLLGDVLEVGGEVVAAGGIVAASVLTGGAADVAFGVAVAGAGVSFGGLAHNALTGDAVRRGATPRKPAPRQIPRLRPMSQLRSQR